jgi:hypothetical protein
MRRFMVAAVAATLLAGGLAHAADGKAPPCNDNWSLHAGSCGQRVSDLQWLLGSHKPNVFTEVKATFRFKPNGSYGARTKSAVLAFKYRIGYPKKGECGAKTTMLVDDTGPLFFAILEGHAKRPACWISLAAGRVKAIVAAQPTKTALAWKALLVSQLGVTESPVGSNRGPRISYSVGRYPSYQSATGAYGVAWCVSTQQWAAQVVGSGHFADDTAGVYYAVDYYAARNLVFAKPKFGSLVAFITYNSRGQRASGTGHMGFVVAVQANSFTYIAGNDSNGVREHTIAFGSRPYAFIRLPGVA